MLPLRHGIRGALPKVPDDNACCVILLIVQVFARVKSVDNPVRQRLYLPLFLLYSCWVSISNKTKTVATKHQVCVVSAPD
jgi:hypothetical protein